MALPVSHTFPGISGDPLSASWIVPVGSWEVGGLNTARSTAGASIISSAYWGDDSFTDNQKVQGVVNNGNIDSADGYLTRLSLAGGETGYAINSNGSVYGTQLYLSKI